MQQHDRSGVLKYTPIEPCRMVGLLQKAIFSDSLEYIASANQNGARRLGGSPPGPAYNADSPVIVPVEFSRFSIY